MRVLFRFVIRNNYYFLFILLEAFCFYLLYSGRNFQGSHLFNSSQRIVASFYKMMFDTKEYLSLREENQRLNVENALLKSAIRSSAGEYFRLHPVAKEDSAYRQKYFYQEAKVIANSTQFRSNYITLNMGARQGIAHDMAIINSEGIVGVVKDVSVDFCSALSILHKDVRVNCKLKGDGSYGPLNWEKENDFETATLTDIPIHARIKKGDTVVTSPLSSIFPEGIMVGKVLDFQRKSGDAFYTVRVGLSTRFRNLNHVYIIKNFYKIEQDSLELKSQVHDKNDH